MCVCVNPVSPVELFLGDDHYYSVLWWHANLCEAIQYSQNDHKPIEQTITTAPCRARLLPQMTLLLFWYSLTTCALPNRLPYFLCSYSQSWTAIVVWTPRWLLLTGSDILLQAWTQWQFIVNPGQAGRQLICLVWWLARLLWHWWPQLWNCDLQKEGGRPCIVQTSDVRLFPITKALYPSDQWEPSRLLVVFVLVLCIIILTRPQPHVCTTTLWLLTIVPAQTWPRH